MPEPPAVGGADGAAGGVVDGGAGVASQGRPGGARRRGLAWAGSLRVRSSLVAVLVVAVALALGGVGLLTLLGSSLKESAQTTASAQVDDVEALLRQGHVPALLPPGRGDTYSQVVAAGRVLASSPGDPTRVPISRLGPDGEGIVVPQLPIDPDDDATAVDRDDDGPYLLVSRRATVGTGPAARPVTVYVAASLDPMRDATRTLGYALAGGLPPFVLLVGVLVWILNGRALRPVEAIRAEVADISGHDLHRRVPVSAAADEVARLATTMNEMLDRLESSATSQRRFVADASHELRSPLASLQATLEVALAHPDDAAWQVAAVDALDEVRRLHRLVEDLLVLARADESGPGHHRDEPVDLDEIVLREARMARGARPVGVDLTRMSAGRVRGDQAHLTRVVHNLLDNACRHAASTVAVELRPDVDQVLLAVQDDGPGIDPADRARVWERFARLDESRSQDDGGTGLGLAIVREIVTAHHGSVVVADSPKGARFEVRLPAESAAEPAGDGVQFSP